MREFASFDPEEYRKRLKLLRLLYGESQPEFARRLGIPFKRYSHYERGYPIPRETAFILREKIQGISTDWIWFGAEGNVPTELLRRLRVLARQQARQQAVSLEQIRRIPKRK